MTGLSQPARSPDGPQSRSHRGTGTGARHQTAPGPAAPSRSWLLAIAAVPLLLTASAFSFAAPALASGFLAAGPFNPPVLAAPSATSVGLPASSDVDRLTGDWSVTYGAPAVVTISFADGTYSEIGKTAVRVTGATCSLPPGTLIATFTGSGGKYTGQHGLWWTTTCGFARWATMSATLDAGGGSLAATFSGGTTRFTRLAPAFRSSVPTPGEVNLSPAVLIESLALAGGVILLVPFPGSLFNSTLRANYDEITEPLRRARRRARQFIGRPWDALRGRHHGAVAAAPLASAVEAAAGGAVLEERHDFWWSLPGVGLFVLLTALLSGFLDPSFGLNEPSIATFVGMLVGLVIVLAAFDLPLTVFCRRRAVQFWMRALPATAAVSVACVLISRLTDFHPGYLYGLVIAIVVVTKFDVATEGRLLAAGDLSAIVVALAAWLALGIVTPLAAAPDAGPLLIVVQTMLSMVVVAGVQAAAFGMLPLSFLAGESVKKWSLPIWAALLGIGWVAFGIVILNPRNGYLSDTTRTPLFTIVALLVLFSVGSVAFWYYFHRRSPEEKRTGA